MAASNKSKMSTVESQIKLEDGKDEEMTRIYQSSIYLDLKKKLDVLESKVERLSFGAGKRTMRLEEAEKKLLSLGQEYKTLIRKYNKKILSNGQDAKAPPMHHFYFRFY